MANPTTNFGWQMPEPTDLVTDLPADFEVFGQAVDTDFVDLLGGTTGQVLAKASNADLDFVWSADAAGMTNPMTTTGDSIYSSSGSTPARLGIGSTGNVLTVAAGVPSWGAAPTSGSMTLLETLTLTGASVTSSTIAGTYNDLYIVIRNFRPSVDTGFLNMRFNGDSGTRYSNTSLNVSTVSNSSFGDSSFRPITMDADNGASTATAIVQIFDYANATTWKMTNYQNFVNGATTPTNWSYSAGRGIYNQTSAITSITLLADSGSITSGTALIYGVK